MTVSLGILMADGIKAQASLRRIHQSLLILPDVLANHEKGQILSELRGTPLSFFYLSGVGGKRPS